MPNRLYEKGRRKEYRIVKEAREHGGVAFRSAGSHSPIDVVAIFPQRGVIELIQAKSDKMPESAMKLIEKKNEALNGTFEVKFKVV